MKVRGGLGLWSGMTERIVTREENVYMAWMLGLIIVCYLRYAASTDTQELLSSIYIRVFCSLFSLASLSPPFPTLRTFVRSKE